jgi:hypothetical protein
MSYEKVFGIGLNKTGTTTLGDMLCKLGLRHKAWAPSFFAMHQNGRVDELIQQTQHYDSFTDWPWPLMAKDLLAHFGENARFILTRRPNAQTWVESLKRHALATVPGNHARYAVYGYEYPQENEAAHIRFYDDHLEQIRQLFTDNHSEHLLLEVCWEEGHGWNDVAGFLRKSAPKCPLPHHNASSARRKFLPFEAANLARIGSLVAQ